MPDRDEAGARRSIGVAVERLVEVVDHLHTLCPWFSRLTHENSVRYLIEEAYEFAEVVAEGAEVDDMRSELGDLLLQVVLHARIASEAGQFDLDDVADTIRSKLIRRSPHLYGTQGEPLNQSSASLLEIERAWQTIKAKERLGHSNAAARSDEPVLPKELPSLIFAQKVSEFIARTPAASEALEIVGSTHSPNGSEGEILGHNDPEVDLGEQILGLLDQFPGVDAESAVRAAALARYHSARSL